MAKVSPAPFINHLSHNHKLELITDPMYATKCATCTAVGSASSDLMYTCKPCSYSVHMACIGKEKEEEKKGLFHHRDRGIFHIHHHKKEEKEEKGKEEKKEKEGKRAKVAAAISGFGVAGKMALKKMAHRRGGGGGGEEEEEAAAEEEEEEVEIEGEEEDGSLIESVLTFFSELEL